MTLPHSRCLQSLISPARGVVTADPGGLLSSSGPGPSQVTADRGGLLSSSGPGQSQVIAVVNFQDTLLPTSELKTQSNPSQSKFI